MKSHYKRAELLELRISRVHSQGEYLCCLLSDGTMVRVPLGIVPAWAASAGGVRAQWQLPEDGKAVVCYAGALGTATKRVSLAQILAHPDLRITVRPSASETASPARPPRHA